MEKQIGNIIRELHADGLHVLPLRHNGEKFIHPQYSGSFDKPFSTEELEKFFADGFNNAYAVIHGKCNPYLKCLDFDEKNAPGKDLYGTWQMLVDPDLLSKLVIERTRSNGYHVYFLCTNKVVEKALASSATGQEWIACRSSEMHGLVYAAPSPGYTYHQGSLFDLQEITGDEMAQLCDAACQLNEYTGEKNFKSTSLAPVQMPANYAPALRAFDREVPDSYILSFLQDQGWTIGERIKRGKVDGADWQFVEVWRPGRTMSESIAGRYWFTNKRLSIFTSSTDLPYWDSGHHFSHSPARVLYFMMKRDWKAVMSFIGEKAEELAIKLPEVTPMAFANPVRGGEVWKVEVKGIIEWAERAGFCWMRMSASSDTVVELIRVVDNIIYVCDEKDLLRAYREEVEANYNGEQSSRVLHAFMPSVFKYMSALPNFDGELMRDEKDCSYMYFSNGALRISAGNVSLVKYSDLPGCVFARHIKNFEYKGHQGTGDFAKFIGFVSVDDDHRRHVMSCLGYILHHYKLRNYAKALMIIEDVEDQEEARGRSGKGLIAQFIEWIRWTVQQDGRNYKSDSQFKMQQIVPGVQVFYLNDPAPNVLMNQFYNFITDDWLVESKGKKSYTIPFKHSPKIMITTNYLPNLESDSDKDRFIVMAIKKHYGSHRSIRDDFPDVIFFSEDWPHADKLMAINFAIECIQLYLNQGVVNYTSEPMKRNAAQRIIKNLVPEALIECLEQAMEACRASQNHYQFGELLKPYDLKKDTSESMTKAFEWKSKNELIVYKSALYQYVTKAYSMKNMTDRVFGKKVNTYLEKSGYEFESTRNNTKGIRILVQLNSNPYSIPENSTARDAVKMQSKTDKNEASGKIDNLEDAPF